MLGEYRTVHGRRRGLLDQFCSATAFVSVLLTAITQHCYITESSWYFQELWLGILGVSETYCLIKDSDPLVCGAVGVVTCRRASTCPDQVYIVNCIYVGGGHFEY